MDCILEMFLPFQPGKTKQGLKVASRLGCLPWDFFFPVFFMQNQQHAWNAGSWWSPVLKPREILPLLRWWLELHLRLLQKCLKGTVSRITLAFHNAITYLPSRRGMAIFGTTNLQFSLSLILSAVSVYESMKPRQAAQPVGKTGMGDCSSSVHELLQMFSPHYILWYECL